MKISIAILISLFGSFSTASAGTNLLCNNQRYCVDRMDGSYLCNDGAYCKVTESGNLQCNHNLYCWKRANGGYLCNDRSYCLPR